MKDAFKESRSNKSVIVAGIDFSEPSHHAIEEAVRITRLEEAKLIICHFLYDEEMANLSKWHGLSPESTIEERKSHLLSWMDKLETSGLELNVRIEIGHVFAPAWKYYGKRSEVKKDTDDYKAELRRQFGDFIRTELTEAKRPPLSFDIRESLSAYHGILESAKEVDADLIVIGLKVRSAKHSPTPGSTAERIIEKSVCSVLSVPPTTIS